MSSSSSLRWRHSPAKNDDYISLDSELCVRRSPGFGPGSVFWPGICILARDPGVGTKSRFWHGIRSFTKTIKIRHPWSKHCKPSTIHIDEDRHSRLVCFASRPLHHRAPKVDLSKYCASTSCHFEDTTCPSLPPSCLLYTSDAADE